MCDTCKFTDDVARVIEMLTKDNELLRKEVQHLYEEIDLVRMRIPACPCGNTMVNMAVEYPSGE